MTKQELEAKVAELANANEILSFDLAVQRAATENVRRVMAQFACSARKERRGTQQVRKQGRAKGNGQAAVKAKLPVDAFGARQGSQGYSLNAFIIPLIENGRYEDIKAEKLSAMSGGAFTKSRFQGHLAWLWRKGLL